MTDWRGWHSKYDDPTHFLSRRLEIVRGELGRILDARGDESTQLVSICAGDGRDTLPVLAERHSDVHTVLVELDDALADAARREAAGLGLDSVEVRTGDAGALATYVGVPPADVFLACGVFGNITDDDLEATVAVLPQLLAPGAWVIWTRGLKAGDDPTEWDGDPADLVRAVFARHEFVDEALVRPSDAGFRVGVHRYYGSQNPRPEDGQVFRFVR